MNGVITIEVEIDDPQALHAKAGSDHCIMNAMEDDAFEEAERRFGQPTEPNIAACLETLFDAGHPEGGVRVVSCSATVDDGAQFETMRCVTVSMEHLTEAEVDTIVALFEPSGENDETRVREEINYAGIYFSSYRYGFIARMPGPEMTEEKLALMTPEMRSIFIKAIGQGARRISFDIDTPPIDGLPVFER